jgi:hypothetical protein
MRHLANTCSTFAAIVALGAMAITRTSFAADPLPGTDNANQADYTDADGWNTGDDGSASGDGFSGWFLYSTYTNGGFAGFFIGDSTTLGTPGANINVTSNSWGLFAGLYGNAGASAEADAYRWFVAPDGVTHTTLGVGETFSLDLAVNFRNGSKGIDLRDASDNTFFTFYVGGDDYLVGGSGVTSGGGSLGNAYDQNTAFHLTFAQASTNGGTWTIIRSGGISSTNSGTYAGDPLSFKLYVLQTDGNDPNNLFANNLGIVAGACNFLASPTTTNFDSTGGGGTISVAASSNSCSWSTSNTNSWISASAGGTGNGTFSYTVSSNASDFPRSGTFTVAGITITINEAGCVSNVSPTSFDFSSAGGTGIVAIAAAGGCSWGSSNVPSWITILSGGSGSGSGSLTFVVSANPSEAGRQASFPVANSVITVKQEEPSLGLVSVDGTRDSLFGCPVSVQALQTSFGDSTNGVVQGSPGGSELDAAYGLIQNDTLFLVFAGNLNNNGNNLNIFIVAGAGGQNTLLANNTNLNSFANMCAGASTPTDPGLTFDTGFAPTHYIGIDGLNVLGSYTLYVNYIDLSHPSPTNGYFLGATGATNGTLIAGQFGFNPFGIQATINNSNTNGVDSGTCAQNLAGSNENALAATVTNGIELGIPLAALGNPTGISYLTNASGGIVTGAVFVCAFISNPDHSYISNQILGPIWDGTTGFCQPDLGSVTNTANINLTNFVYAGASVPQQHWFAVGPELKVTSFKVTGNNVNITYQTANTNFAYQLQRTLVLSNRLANLNWVNVGAPVAGTGGTITQQDTNGATNKPSAFYRVKQVPLCP